MVCDSTRRREVRGWRQQVVQDKEEGEQGMDAIRREVQVVREERAGEVLKLVEKVDEMSQQWSQNLDDQMSGLRVVLEATRRDVRLAREEGADEMRRVLGKAEEVGQQWGRGLDDDVGKLVGRMEEMQQRMEQRWREEFKHEVLTASLKEELGRTRREMLTAKEESAWEMREVMGKMEELKHSMILELRHEKEQVEKARREKEQAEKARREEEQAEKARREKEQWPQLRSKQLRDCIQYYFPELLEEEDDDSELMAEECQRRLEKWQLAEEFEHVFERAQGKRAEKVEKARERRRVEFRQTDWKQRKEREVTIDMKRERLQRMEIMTGEVEVGKVEEKKVVKGEESLEDEKIDGGKDDALPPKASAIQPAPTMILEIASVVAEGRRKNRCTAAREMVTQHSNLICSTQSLLCPVLLPAPAATGVCFGPDHSIHSSRVQQITFQDEGLAPGPAYSGGGMESTGDIAVENLAMFGRVSESDEKDGVVRGNGEGNEADVAGLGNEVERMRDDMEKVKVEVAGRAKVEEERKKTINSLRKEVEGRKYGSSDVRKCMDEPKAEMKAEMAMLVEEREKRILGKLDQLRREVEEGRAEEAGRIRELREEVEAGKVEVAWRLGELQQRLDERKMEASGGAAGAMDGGEWVEVLSARMENFREVATRVEGEIQSLWELSAQQRLH
ncbi:unnamed protein product [Closterium sp. NIES-64]|nr:unnamed protein product [Closterium sp. NIES-64]